MNDNSIINETLISRDNLELYKNETDKKIRNYVENKISENIDDTLTKSGFSADSSVVGEKIDEINGSISTLGNEINQNKTDILTAKTDIQNLQNQDSVLSSRIDNLSTLAEGSTTGDAELADIRVGIDGTIYANAGTAVREQVSELKQDLVCVEEIVGSNVRLTYTTTDKMIGTDGTEKTPSKVVSLYEINDLRDANTLIFEMETAGGSNYVTHWFNQIDENGNVLDYTPFKAQTLTRIEIDLLDECVSVKFSMFSINGKFSVFKKSTQITEQIGKNTEQIGKNTEQIGKNAKQIAEIVGGEINFDVKSTDTMFDGSGNVKTLSSELYKFYEITDLEGASSLKIEYESTGKYNTHWWNEFDSDGNLIYYETKKSQDNKLEVALQPTTKSVKFLIWKDMGEFNCTHTVISDIVKKSDITSGYVKLSALGDSITYGYYLDNGSSARVEKTYHQLIAERLGIEFQNLGVSSTPICPNSNYTDGQNEQAFVYRYSQIASDADLILVCGGTNDFRHLVPVGTSADDSTKYEQTFYGAVDYLINNIMLVHPMARLVFITPFHQINDTSAKTTLNGETVYLSDYITALKTKCKQYGVLCIDAFAESGVSLRDDFVTRFMPDSLHPNNDGHKIIFRNLIHYFATL